MLFRIILACVVIFLFGYFVMYNRKIMLKIFETKEVSEGVFYKFLGRRIKRLNIRVYRTVNLDKKSLLFKGYSYIEDIIINLDMAKDNVSVVGFLFFILLASFSCSLLFSVLINAVNLLPFAFLAFAFFIMVVFRLTALMMYEKRESEIMDAIDLLVSDVSGGVYNAILRYRNSFHANIRPYFMEFLDDIQNKGYGFRQAMLLLNDRLGSNFTEFAQKAIMYEEKADRSMEDIFSSIIETNRYRRTLRFINTNEFNTLRSQFLISIFIIGAYALFTIVYDDYLANFLLNSSFGKLLLIIDVVIVGVVLAFLASIKAKTL